MDKTILSQQFLIKIRYLLQTTQITTNSQCHIQICFNYKLNLNFSLIISIPALVFSNENLDKSKLFIEKLGQEVMGKVSNPSITDSQRYNNFKNIYLAAFDNYYISRFVLGRHWKKLITNTK